MMGGLINMKRQVRVFVSQQANLMLDNMSEIKVEDVMTWFCDVRKISIGGGDIVDYLNYKKGLSNND